MMDFTFFSVDVFIIIIVFLSFIIGWARGATREILSVVAWCGGIYLAIALFPYAKEFMRGYISHKLIADFVTVCGLFIMFLTLLSVFNYFCSNLVKKSMLNTTDKALGGLFGIFRGAIILAIIELIINQCMLSEPPKFIENSKLRPTITAISNFMILVLPDELQEKILTRMPQNKKQMLMDFLKDGLINKMTPHDAMNILEHSEKNRVIAEDAKKTDEKPEDDEFIEDEDISIGQKAQSAEELATLRPKKVETERHAHKLNSKSRNDMDRLLSQYEAVEE